MPLTINSVSTRMRSRKSSKSKTILFEYQRFQYLCSLESTLYNQSHTKTMLTAERESKSKLLSKIRAENAISDRAIKQNKLAQNKKDERHKELRNIRYDMREDLDKTN